MARDPAGLDLMGEPPHSPCSQASRAQRGPVFWPAGAVPPAELPGSGMGASVLGPGKHEAGVHFLWILSPANSRTEVTTPKG